MTRFPLRSEIFGASKTSTVYVAVTRSTLQGQIIERDILNGFLETLIFNRSDSIGGSKVGSVVLDWTFLTVVLLKIVAECLVEKVVEQLLCDKITINVFGN